MKRSVLHAAVSVAAFFSISPAFAQTPSKPVTIESYYRIKWGSAEEFKDLYRRNHQPILQELQKQGLITGMRVDAPFTHMSGGPRWDLRVTITYRDAPSAVEVGGPYDKAADAVTARLYPDKKRLETDEARRFSLLEDHWDVIVTPAD